MKKIYTFFALLLLCAVTAVAQTTIYSQGTQVTSTDGLLDGNKYVIRVSGGSYITESNSQYVAPNTTQNSITSAAVFTFKANGSTWKVLNESTGNYWGTLTGSATGTFSTATEENAGDWTFSFSNNNFVGQSNGYYINRSSGVMHGWTGTIGLQLYNADRVTMVTALDQLSNEKVYNIRNNRGTWAVGNGASEINSTVELNLAFLSSDIKQQFAFITYEGNVYLYSVSEKKFAYIDGTKLSLTAEVNSAVENSKITFENSTAGVANEPIIVTVNGSHFGVSTSYSPDVYKYQSANDGGNCARVQEAGSFDPTEAIEALDEYFLGEEVFNNVISQLEAYPYGTGIGNYSLTVEGTDYTSQAADIIADLKDQGFSRETASIANQLLSGTSINLPTVGFYRIKGYSGNYITSNNKASNAAMNGEASANNIVFYNADGNLIFYGSGFGLYNTCIVAPLDQTKNAYTFSEGTQLGKYYIRSNYSSGGTYCYDNTANGTKVDRNGAPVTSEPYQTDWTLEEVTELPITLHSVDGTNYFATFSAPVPVRIEGATLNNVTPKANSISYKAVDTKLLPANTGVLLTGTSASATAYVVTDEVADAGYGLQAYDAAFTVSDNTKLFLGKNSNNNVGFYALGSASTNGFKAYFVNSTTGEAKEGFELVNANETTGVESIDNSQLTIDNAPVYNLQGQRVNKAQKGVFIQNGKKVVVK